MNYERLNKLAKEAVKYMNPENDWRFIHADSYTFYNLLPNNNYSSSFPMWKELHHEIFNDIRTSLNDQGLVINNFTLVKATPYTICHPIRSYGGVSRLVVMLTVQYEAGIIIPKKRVGHTKKHTDEQKKWQKDVCICTHLI